MDAGAWISELLLRLAAEPLLLVPAIILATFVLEDVATVTVAVLASRMLIPSDHALIAVFAGTFLGDVALYAAARWASEWRFVRRWLERPGLARALAAVRRHAVPAVIIARFLPGTRLPVFVAAGAAGMPAPLFVGLTFATTLLWTPGLYFAAAAAERQAASLLGSSGWTVAILLSGGLALSLPRLVRRIALRVAA